jgi:pimeloyl-ACP methyl ester carboxylesterase
MIASKVASTARTVSPPPSPDAAARLRLDDETPGRAIQAADGVWVIATNHRPGFNRHMFEINNRTIVFQLRDQRLGCPVLLVANGSDPAQAAGEVRRIALQTGLPVRYVVSPGGGHHLTLDRWHEAFPEAQILVPPLRVPRTANGGKLMRLPRVAAMDLADPLPQFRGELDAVIFQGLLGSRDRSASSRT